MKRLGCTDLWSVHDSFGCHANHVETMRTILANQFSIIHSLSSDEPNVLKGLILATSVYAEFHSRAPSTVQGELDK